MAAGHAASGNPEDLAGNDVATEHHHHPVHRAHEFGRAGAPAHALRDGQRIERGLHDPGQQANRARARLSRPACTIQIRPWESRAAPSAATSTPQLRGEGERSLGRLRPARRTRRLTGGPRRSIAAVGLLFDQPPHAHRQSARCCEALDCAVRRGRRRRGPLRCRRAKAVASVSSDFGGSSSVPISTRKSRLAAITRPLAVIRCQAPTYRASILAPSEIGAWHRICSIGKPSASRLA